MRDEKKLSENFKNIIQPMLKKVLKIDKKQTENILADLSRSIEKVFVKAELEKLN